MPRQSYRPILYVASAAALCCLLAAPPAHALGQDVVALEILHDGEVIAAAAAPINEPVTVQLELNGPVLAFYPESASLRGDAVHLAVYQVDDLRQVNSKEWIEDVDVDRSATAALEKTSSRLALPGLAVRLTKVELTSR